MALDFVSMFKKGRGWRRVLGANSVAVAADFPVLRRVHHVIQLEETGFKQNGDDRAKREESIPFMLRGEQTSLSLNSSHVYTENNVLNYCSAPAAAVENDVRDDEGLRQAPLILRQKCKLSIWTR